MAHPELVLLVKFKSALPFDEVMKVVHSRADEFRALGGLQQKYYLQENGSDEIAGLYLWSSAEAFNEYRQSALRASIAEAYQAVDEPRVEVFKVLMPLRDTPV